MAEIFSIENDNLVFFYKNKKYKFNYNSYNETFLDALYATKDDEKLFEQIQWNPLYYYNFYNENDTNFLKNLIKKIRFLCKCSVQYLFLHFFLFFQMQILIIAINKY